MSAPRNPDRHTVRRIIDEEAARHFVSADLIINLSPNLRASAARAAAIRRIIAISGCSKVGLAEVWGCSAETVFAALRSGADAPIYDDATRHRLTWAHGEDRAADIIAGRDIATTADIASWRRLCWRAAA